MEAAAAVGSIASVGFKAAGTMAEGQGVAAGDQFKAQQLERQAQYGQLQGVQVAAAQTQKLATTLGNIRAQQAAMGTSSTSPTGAAMVAGTEKFGMQQVQISMDNAMEQARQQEADAQYLRTAASTALLTSKLKAGAQIGEAVGQGLSSPMFGLG